MTRDMTKEEFEYNRREIIRLLIIRLDNEHIDEEIMRVEGVSFTQRDAIKLLTEQPDSEVARDFIDLIAYAAVNSADSSSN